MENGPGYTVIFSDSYHRLPICQGQQSSILSTETRQMSALFSAMGQQFQHECDCYACLSSIATCADYLRVVQCLNNKKKIAVEEHRKVHQGPKKQGVRRTTSEEDKICWKRTRSTKDPRNEKYRKHLDPISTICQSTGAAKE